MGVSTVVSTAAEVLTQPDNAPSTAIPVASNSADAALYYSSLEDVRPKQILDADENSVINNNDATINLLP